MENLKFRGAQPGNTNALRHGLYSAKFKAAELKAVHDLQCGSAPSVAEEIAASRLILRRIVDRIAKEEDMPLETHLHAVWIIIQSSWRIGRLVSLEQALHPNK